MKHKHILAVAVAAALASAVAVAQTTTVPAVAAKPRVQVDANGDGFIDRAEAARMPRLAERFDTMDTNKDGRLGADERPKGGHGKRGKHGAAGGWMKKADTDGDGRISRVEAQALPAKAGERFERMDVNKDGYLDRTDRQARMDQERAEFFVGADDNKDAQLSRDEFVVEQGARAADMRERWAQRAADSGKQGSTRPAPTLEQQVQRSTAAFDRMDADKNGSLTRAEFNAGKQERRR